jgi:hypothetical protein
MAFDPALDRCFRLDNRNYYIHFEQVVGRLLLYLTEALEQFEQDLIPLTVVRWSQIDSSQQSLDSVCCQYSQADDVWSPGFSSGKYASILSHPATAFYRTS